MRKSLLFVLSALLLVSCATAPSGGGHSLGAAEKEQLLRERVMMAWNAMVERDRGKIWEMYDPFFRARQPKGLYEARKMSVYYYDPQIREVDIKGNVAIVKVRVDYEVKDIKTRLGKVINEPKKETISTDTWVFMDGNWYRQYISNISESSLLQY